MGGAKRWLEEIEARGWTDLGTTVCSDCVSDEALQRFVQLGGGRAECSYCSRTPEWPDASANTELILELIVDGFRTEYEDPIEQVLYSSADGGYQMAIYDPEDLLEIHEVTENGDLFADLARSITQMEWVPRDPYAASPTQALQWGWEGFRDFVKHRRRYTFLAFDQSTADGAGEIAMHGIPAAVTAAVEEAGQITTLVAGTSWWRVRPHDASKSYSSARDLGSPPDGVARDNRMTPKGIGAFYGASTAAGARAEVAGYAGKSLDGTIGKFALLRDVLVVDLTTAGAIPSLFDPEEGHKRAARKFMHDFVKDVAKIADPSDTQNLDYVPTQIIAEYFRYELHVDEERVGGVIWRSSRDSSVTNCVLFVGNEAMAEQGTGSDVSILALDPKSVARIDAPL
ncbi:HEPN-associated N-terminal domain-containing protein [Schumannella sp. 10F1B-5-1]|uniref:HEPN-associated N-terminal domain-containing protein n=1 Tax=Schumannella sp. 10F1B-5-1 TaxID=2590780 RepID=UPI0011313DA9|nr:HEPN-associated N-terminal domain-containing protein [Schumannella sp. 10F1B-5-1]TPW73603.1 RES domain-containing protein [Schumannella sp. 10F1B-5-1]